jgi:hypothetical protein
VKPVVVVVTGRFGPVALIMTLTAVPPEFVVVIAALSQTCSKRQQVSLACAYQGLYDCQKALQDNPRARTVAPYRRTSSPLSDTLRLAYPLLIVLHALELQGRLQRTTSAITLNESWGLRFVDAMSPGSFAHIQPIDPSSSQEESRRKANTMLKSSDVFE